MAKRIIKIRNNERPPENGKYLTTTQERETCGTRHEWRDSPGFWGKVPIFGRETLYKITEYQTVTYHHYEVEEGESNGW